MPRRRCLPTYLWTNQLSSTSRQHFTSARERTGTLSKVFLQLVTNSCSFIASTTLLDKSRSQNMFIARSEYGKLLHSLYCTRKS